MTLEDLVQEALISVKRDYCMPDDQAQAKYKEIYAKVSSDSPGMREQFYVHAAVARLRQYARAHHAVGTWRNEGEQ